MSKFLFLDSGPLGLITHPQRTDEVIAVNEWLALWLLNGNRVVVPADQSGTGQAGILQMLTFVVKYDNIVAGTN